jgi:hypothetical protein
LKGIKVNNEIQNATRRRRRKNSHRFREITRGASLSHHSHLKGWMVLSPAMHIAVLSSHYACTRPPVAALGTAALNAVQMKQE